MKGLSTVVWIGIVTTGLLLAGCEGSATSACAPDNCQGCCMAGECVSGDVPAACGAGGSLCAACGVGDICQYGQCRPAVTSCLGCAGCCFNGQCQSGTSDVACGFAPSGVTVAPECRACTAGQTCRAGLCENNPPACSSANCQGCCQGDVCIFPGTNSGCGAQGRPCVPCTGTTKCHEGECLDTAGCDNCSKLNGCCQNNTCVPGTSSAGCGQGGSPCDVCEQGEVCVDGACVRSTVACDYKTCPNGCCAADGCKQPFSDQSCGIGGLGCRACGPWEFCVAGYCQPKAVGCALSCVYGCCYGDQCLPFAQQTALLCGNNGQACRSCDQVRGEVCDIGQGLCNIQSSGTCPNCTGIDQCCNERNVCVNGESNLQCGSNGAKCQNCSLAPFGAGFSCHSQIGMGTNKCDDGSGGTTTICVESVRVNCKAGTSGASAICQQDLGEGPPLGFEVHIKVGLLTRNTNSAAASWDQQGSGIALATYANQCPHGGLSASDLADPITISVYETDPDAFNADDLVVGSCVVPQADLQSGLSSGRAEISCTTVDGGSCTVTLLFR